MIHGSLFSGLDAPSVAANWMGWENAFHCEINDFCNTILKYWFPNSKHYEDITKTDFSQWRGRIDILTGGFPCQPFSVAGQRKGADDNRYLWPHMLRAIREIRPTWVIGENVAGILTMVQPGEEVEMGSQATLFGEDNRKRVLLRQEYVVETICKDLEREGYSVQPLLIPACAVGAPHRRDRVWFVAHRTDARAKDVRRNREDSILPVGNVANSDGKRCHNGSDNWGERHFHNDQERSHEKNKSEWDEREHWVGKNGATSSNTNSQRHTSCRTSEKPERIRCGNNGEQEERGQSPEWIDGFHGLLRPFADSQRTGSGQVHEKVQSKQPNGNCIDCNGSERDVTNSNSKKLQEWFEDGRRANTKKIAAGMDNGVERLSSLRYAPYSDNKRLQGCINFRSTGEEKKKSGYEQFSRSLFPDWKNFPTQSPVCRGNDGLPFDVDNLTIPFTKWRQESVKGYGNAIVPQVILEIFKAIEEIEQLE